LTPGGDSLDADGSMKELAGDKRFNGLTLLGRRPLPRLS
jgi:hypothetical protein